MFQLMNTVSDELRTRSNNCESELIRPFPGLHRDESGWHPASPLEEGVVYELPFDGNDADAGVLEKAT